MYFLCTVKGLLNNTRVLHHPNRNSTKKSKADYESATPYHPHWKNLKKPEKTGNLRKRGT